MNKINDSMKKKNSAIFPLHGSSQVLNLKYCFSEHLMSVTLVRTVCPTVVFAAKIKKSMQVLVWVQNGNGWHLK